MGKHGHNPKVGLLGGSFNPAHDGHVEISLAALKILDLDFIWWLVSPGNPLKGEDDMAPYQDRLTSAKEIVNDERIIVSEIEKDMETRYTVNTLEKLKTELPNYNFVWLMGADNLAQFDQWKDWRKIANTVPFAIFNRPSYSRESLQSVAAKELEKYLIDCDQASTLHKLKPPAWIYYELTNNPLSSTEIRQKIK